jgi:hypothetical protein
MKKILMRQSLVLILCWMPVELHRVEHDVLYVSTRAMAKYTLLTLSPSLLSLSSPRLPFFPSYRKGYAMSHLPVFVASSKSRVMSE